jgi:hypothetical protein
MRKDEVTGLQRIDGGVDLVRGTSLPAGFDQLSADDQRMIVVKMAEQDVDLRHKLQESVGSSKIAEHDLATAIETISRLDHERKIYHLNQKAKTGSGEIKLDVRGGDTRFIVPVVIAVGVVIVVILIVLAAALSNN